jgi:hypothetical protein
VKEKIEDAPAKTEIRPAAWNLEIKVRERDVDAVAASEREVALLAVAQGWVNRALVLVAVFSISAIYVAAHVGSGWVPADDGILGQSALRVMQGQLPHRDFAEIYTGGLCMIHALAFRLFGVNLISLRICAFLFFLAWVPAVYYIALRFTTPIAAGLITLVAVAWSFPNYPAAMPSWYNLFFATFGAAALLRYLEVPKSRWLFVSGVCGGVSVLIKVTGAYYVAGVLLFLAYYEQQQSEPRDDGKSSSRKKSAISYRVFTTTALLLFLLIVFFVFHARLGGAELYHFVLPATVVVALILQGERSVGVGASVDRLNVLLRLVFPFLVGALSPVFVFLIPYVRSGAVTRFFSGVVASVVARSAGLGVLRPPSIGKIGFALIPVALVAAAMYLREFQGKLVAMAASLALLLVLVKAPTSSGIVSAVWFSVAALTPLVVLAGAAGILQAQKKDGRPKLQQHRIMLLISLAAMCGLVQYPFSAPIYLCYALPLTLLAAVAIVATAKKQPGTYILAGVAGFYTLFGVSMLVPDHIYELTHRVGSMSELQLERAGGLNIEYAPNFVELIHFLQQHSPNGFMFAGNDCPELYFLSGLNNATRDDGATSPEEALQAVQSDNLNLAVINESPYFPGGAMRPEVRAEIMRKFPHSMRFGIFQVFWKR